MKWSRGKVLGHGSSAAVSLAKSLPSGEIFAVKSVEYSRSDALRKEQEIHSTLKCDRIIEYKGYDVTLENGEVLYNIFLEYASGGTLIDAVYKKGGGLSNPLVRRYTREILGGLAYLHSKGIVHCDIKGANILVTTEGVKIGDFGSCAQVDDVAGIDLSGAKIGGTPLYMAPEVARGEQQSYPADVWALGCTIFEMATRLSPWPNITQDPLSALYHIGFSGALPEIPDFLSDQAKDFLSHCLKRDPKDRWTVAELLQHPFVIGDGPAHGPSLYTPTSILDQGIWTTLDESQSAQTCVVQERPTKGSPNERIVELMVDSSWGKLPHWTWDEEWITVRSDDTSDEPNKICSGLGLHLGQNIQPNIASGNFIVEPKFSFHTVQLLSCCKDTICSTSSSKKKSDEITKNEFTYYCTNINFSLSNHGEFSSSIILAKFRISIFYYLTDDILKIISFFKKRNKAKKNKTKHITFGCSKQFDDVNFRKKKMIRIRIDNYNHGR